VDHAMLKADAIGELDFGTQLARRFVNKIG
jgi:hypothetical protein